MLCYRFGKMAAWLRTQSFAHGDIKPDNIIVRPDGSLSLVDYDGMFVPSIKGCKSPTVGTKDFCHPLRTVDDFDETIDDFSLASIALSLKAISMNSTLLDTYGASDRLLFSENDYRNPSNSKVISALQGLMCDKDFCTLYSLFMLSLARKELSACSFRLFVGEKPLLPQIVEDLSTEATEKEWKEAFVDEWGVKYSKDGRKLLDARRVQGVYYIIKDRTKIICDGAFNCCSALAEVVIPNSVTSIGNSAFANCSALSNIAIPDSVTSIGNYAFSSCCSLSDIIIPDSVENVGNGAFEYCSLLECISIPESVICLNGNPFCNWNGKLECLSSSFIYEDDVLFNMKKSEIISFRKQKIESYIIPDSVTSIGDSAFSGCHSLSNIVIPDSVTSIGNYAFSSCCSLSGVIIPDSVTSIGNHAFKGCSSLSNIVIPDSVTSIGDWAFSDCHSLSNIVISDSVIRIGTGAFSGCTSLSNIVIPDSVTSIEYFAFSRCYSLSNIVIPDSVTSIGEEAFCDCSNLSYDLKQKLISRFGDKLFLSPDQLPF